MYDGIEILHALPGGPFHHTDAQPRQFMIDIYGNVLINDFNGSKFQLVNFESIGKDHDTGGINTDGDINKDVSDVSIHTPHLCWYCGHRSRGQKLALIHENEIICFLFDLMILLCM